jgi:cell division GTPase FtsZ
MPTFLKKIEGLQQHQNQTKKIHFVGVGGAGCNVVEYAMKQMPNAKFTFINNSTRKNIPKGVEFIDVRHCHSSIYYNGFSMSMQDFYGMKEVVKVFDNEDMTYLIFVGLGGNTGSKFCNPILRYLRKRKFPCFMTVSMPFNYEGNTRNIIANFTKNEINRFNPNMYILDPNDLKDKLGNNTVSDAFKNIDRMMYDIAIGSIEYYDIVETT